MNQPSQPPTAAALLVGRRLRPVRPNHLQAGQQPTHPLQQSLGTVAVLDIRRQDRQAPNQTERVNQHMPLAAADFFSPRRSPWDHPLRLS